MSKGLYHWIPGNFYGKYWTDARVQGGVASITNASSFWNMVNKRYSLLFLKEGFAKYNPNFGHSPGVVYKMLLTMPIQTNQSSFYQEIIWVNPTWVTPLKK